MLRLSQIGSVHLVGRTLPKFLLSTCWCSVSLPKIRVDVCFSPRGSRTPPVIIYISGFQNFILYAARGTSMPTVETAPLCSPMTHSVWGGSSSPRNAKVRPASHLFVSFATRGKDTLTLSLPRVINFKFPLQPHLKILHHTAWRTQLFTVSDERRLYLPILTT